MALTVHHCCLISGYSHNKGFKSLEKPHETVEDPCWKSELILSFYWYVYTELTSLERLSGLPDSLIHFLFRSCFSVMNMNEKTQKNNCCLLLNIIHDILPICEIEEFSLA